MRFVRTHAMSMLISPSVHNARVNIGQQAKGEACLRNKPSRKARVCAEPEDTRQVFQVAPSRSNTTYEDARLAMECCDCLDDKNRADCYASFGCDVERVDKYLGAVLRLEDMYAAPLNTEEARPATFSVTTPFGVTHLPVPPQLPTPPAMRLPANIRLPSMPNQPPSITLPDADEVLLGLLDAANSTSQQMARFREAWEQVRHEFEDAAHLMFDEAHLEQAPSKTPTSEMDSGMDWGRSPPRSR